MITIFTHFKNHLAILLPFIVSLSKIDPLPNVLNLLYLETEVL